MEPVLQYVYATASAEQALLRRHWLAWGIPTVTVVAENPDCVGCAIGTDLGLFANQYRPEMVAAAPLPAGTDATHMAETIDAMPGSHTRYVRTIVNADTLLEDLACADDLDTTYLPKWCPGGNQRWVAHATIGLITNADQQLLTVSDLPLKPQQSSTTSNPSAYVHHATTALADTPITFSSSRSGTHRAPFSDSPPQTLNRAGVRTSTLQQQDRCIPAACSTR